MHHIYVFWRAMLFAMLLSACSSPPDSDPERYSLLIVNGTVYDGSTAAPASVNIGVSGDRIVTMEAAADAQGDRIIDANGLVVVPGFIDPHTHAGEDLLDAERSANLNYLTQGVTTVFIGNDGRGLENLEEQLATMRSQGIGTNVAFFTGHGTARTVAMGLEDRAPTEDELERMKEFVADEMRAGALGLSTGLYYRPGSYAETGEVIELAKVAANFDGIYDSHIRDESSYNIGLLGAIREVIEIGEAAAIPVHIAHIKALGRDVWGQSGDIVAIVAAARERGVDVTADQYPWRASGTSIGGALVPRWVMADSNSAMLERLGNPDLEDRIRSEMEANLWRRGGAESLLITGESEWRGLTLEDIAERTGRDPVDAAIEVVRSGDPSVASFNMQPDDMEVIAIQPWVMTGSDGSEGHPRKYATYPKAYRDLVADKPLMPLQRFVHRSSGLVADTFGLCNRGYLRAGRIADIVIIDLDNYVPVADFEDPTLLSTGVVHLVVNGAEVIAGGEFNGGLHGTIINRRTLDCAE